VGKDKGMDNQELEDKGWGRINDKGIDNQELEDEGWRRITG